jgi:diacylglycerol kinase (ATP)
MKKILVLINPKAGNDKNKALQDLISQELGAYYNIYFEKTAYAGHATLLAQQAVLQKYFAVIAVGGDGSINEIASALVHTETALGIIPRGSGNGIARSLQIDLDASSALKTIKNGIIQHIDVGIVNDQQYFFSNLGVGFDVAISKSFANATTRGFQGYVAMVFKHYFSYKCNIYEIITDGKPAQIKEAFMLNIANAEQFGLNFKIAPHASMNDGKFDIILTKNFPKLLGLKITWQAFTGKILNNKYIEKWHGKNLIIRSKNNLSYYQVDGDVKANNNSNELKISIIPSALKVFQP